MSWLALLWMLVVVASISWVLANSLTLIFSPLVRNVADLGVRKHLWVMVLAPWLLPILAVLTLVFLAVAKAQGWIHHHCETHLAHHPHFCFEHLPTFALQLTNSIVGLVIVFCSFALLISRFVPILRLYTKSQFFLRLVSGRSLINTLKDDRPMAFTLGIVKPSIFVSDGLRKSITKKELNIVMRHEIAHVRHKDVLKNTLFELLLSFHLLPKILRPYWYLSSEIRADRYVAQKFGALDVADVLLKLSRTNKSSLFPTSINGSQLSKRIHVLLNTEESNRTHSSIYFLYLVIIAVPITIALSHHGLETLWGWLL